MKKPRDFLSVFFCLKARASRKTQPSPAAACEWRSDGIVRPQRPCGDKRRDEVQRHQLAELDWQVSIVWECQLGDIDTLIVTKTKF